MEQAIKVLLVDDHELILLGIKRILSAVPNVELVGTASNGEETIDKIRLLQPDIVILDIDIPKISGIDLTENIQKNFPNTKVILHTSYVDEEHIVKGFELGASGYVPKNFKPEDLIEAITTVHQGKRYLKGIVSDIFMESFFKEKQIKKEKEETPAPDEVLTKREIEVLKLISQGMTNQEMAETLFISVRTVEVHKANIMKKLNMNSTADLVKYAIKNNIISL